MSEFYTPPNVYTGWRERLRVTFRPCTEPRCDPQFEYPPPDRPAPAEDHGRKE